MVLRNSVKLNATLSDQTKCNGSLALSLQDYLKKRSSSARPELEKHLPKGVENGKIIISNIFYCLHFIIQFVDNKCREAAKVYYL